MGDYMKKIQIFAMLFLGVMLLTGCCGSTGNVQGSSAPSQTVKNTSVLTNDPGVSTSGKSIENRQVGTTYKIDYMSNKYEVTLVKTAYDYASFTGKQYLLAYFEIKNTGSSSAYFTPKIYALDADSEKYDSTIAFGLSPEYEKTLSFIKELSPNTKTSGWAVIEVPDGVTGLDLYFEYTNIYLSGSPQYIKYKMPSS